MLNKKQQELVNKWAEVDALGEHLSEWPEDLSYEKVLEFIENGDEDIITYEPFEDYPGHELVEKIETMKRFHVRNFTEIYQELKNAE